MDEIKKTIKEYKNNRAPGYDEVIRELMKLEGKEPLKKFRIPFNNCIWRILINCTTV